MKVARYLQIESAVRSALLHLLLHGDPAPTAASPTTEINRDDITARAYIVGTSHVQVSVLLKNGVEGETHERD